MPFDAWPLTKKIKRNGKTVWRRLPWLKSTLINSTIDGCIITDLETLPFIHTHDLIRTSIFVVIEREEYYSMPEDSKPRNISRVCFTIAQAVLMSDRTRCTTHILGSPTFIAETIDSL